MPAHIEGIGFRERILARHTRSVAGMEAYNPNYIGGDVVTGSNDARQILFRPRVALDPLLRRHLGRASSAQSRPWPLSHCVG